MHVLSLGFMSIIGQMPYLGGHPGVQTNFQGLGRGGRGGLCIYLKGHSSENSINVTNCWFEENSAIWGGGLCISFQDAPVSNVKAKYRKFNFY